MNNLEPGIAFGAGKAGMGFDILRYITTPQVILQFLSLLFNLVVYFCINGRGYSRDNVCLYNNNANACKVGTLVSYGKRFCKNYNNSNRTLVSGLGIVASVVYLGAEYMFQTTSSVKMRRYSIRTSLGVAGTFAILYFLNFAYLSISWSKALEINFVLYAYFKYFLSKADYPAFGYGLNSCRTAIAFSFFAIFTFAGSAWFAYKRFMAGIDMTSFVSGYDAAQLGVDGLRTGTDGTEYTTYATGNMADPQYANQTGYTQNLQDVNINQENYSQPSY